MWLFGAGWSESPVACVGELQTRGLAASTFISAALGGCRRVGWMDGCSGWWCTAYFSGGDLSDVVPTVIRAGTANVTLL